MRSLLPGIGGLLLPLVNGCADPARPDMAPPPRPDPGAVIFAQCLPLIGQWVDSTTSARTIVFEQWRQASDSLLIGYGYAMSGNDTVFIEDLKLERSGHTVVYSARVDSQNGGEWVSFTSGSSPQPVLVFENAAHDWPQRIVYQKNAEDHWSVRVSGNEDGRSREENFLFRRVPGDRDAPEGYIRPLSLSTNQPNTRITWE